MLSIKVLYRKAPELRLMLVRGVHKSYYDALGLTPKATQADIKLAYYKMSMVYHPDKADGNIEKFREISSAYEVLSNSKLRKLYDGGMLPTGAGKYTSAKESETAKQAQAAEAAEKLRKYEEFIKGSSKTRRKEYDFGEQKKTYTGKSDKYNFDAWTSAHYSENFARREFVKNAFRDRPMNSEKTKQIDRIATISFLFLLISCGYYTHTVTDFDYPGSSSSLKRKD